MNRHLWIIAFLLTAIGLLAAGCNLAGPYRRGDAELAHYKQLARTVEHADLNTAAHYWDTPAPRTIHHNAVPNQWWDLTVDEAIQIALTNSAVLHDLGGTIVRSPETARTILNPAIVSSDPRFGMEAALSAFDAQLSSSVSAEKNDRLVNNFVASGGTRIYQQDLVAMQSQITKLGAAGTQMTLRGVTTYDYNNASFNKFPSVWDTLVDVEVRQPLLQGAGVRFNRLAGPNSFPGFYNGVLIARVNADVSVADFEIGLRDLVSNVENAYWDLYFAFRDLDAKISSRNASLDAWKRVQIMIQSGQPGGTPEREAQAREQYYRYEEEVQNSLSGKLQDATVNNNGTSGGSFRGIGGVLVCERRLRLAAGLPITDGRMIRPADEPTLAQVRFDWPTASADAIDRRPELHRQRLLVKRREMEMVAARNFLLPRFDILSRYRFRGLGKNLIGDAVVLPDPQDPENFFANSSLANLANGNFQEWQLGAEVTMPVGYRRGYAGVRSAQLNLARDKAVLEEQERQVMHDLSNVVGDLDRAYQVMQTSYNRRLAAQQNVEILRQRMQSDRPVTPEQLLDSERRLSDADSQYHRALVEHMLAIKNVHFEKGTLLEYAHVMLSENLPSPQAQPEPAPDPAPPQVEQPLPAPLPEPAPPLPAPPPPVPQLPLQQSTQFVPPAEQAPVAVQPAMPLAPTPAPAPAGPVPSATAAAPSPQSILLPRMESLPPLPAPQAVPPPASQAQRESSNLIEQTLFGRDPSGVRAPPTAGVITPVEPPPGTLPPGMQRLPPP